MRILNLTNETNTTNTMNTQITNDTTALPENCYLLSKDEAAQIIANHHRCYRIVDGVMREYEYVGLSRLVGKPYFVIAKSGGYEIPEFLLLIPIEFLELEEFQQALS